MDRKTFIKKTAGGLLLAIPAFALINCSPSDDSSSNSPPTGGNPDCLANGTNSSIGANHGHSLAVSSTDVNAGVEKTYNIAGSAGHSHSVTVSAANFNVLKNNQQISVNSTTGDAHTHSVTISCA
ncbi:MAG: hypothetical protein DRI75_00500 [Bacteroidetes bacterium]|nr:MAG: hypothetical protein DRI75_00500 [Bacteroidota bacterium]